MVHESVEVPEPVTLVGLREQDRPAPPVQPRLTVPVKPFTGVTVMVELPVGEALTESGFAAMVKFVGVKVTVTWRESEPLVPVTVTIVVVVKVHVRVALPEPVTLGGLMLHAGLFADRFMVPLKPFSAVVLIVDVPVPPTVVTELGLAVRAKSST